MNKRERRELVKQKRAKKSRHHIINKCRHQHFNNIADKDNIINTNSYDHEKRHSFFHNDAPHEAFERLKEWLGPVLNEHAKELLDALSKPNIYQEKFIKK